MTDYMVTGLERRRAELAGRVHHLQRELADLVKDVEHIDAVLRIVAPVLCCSTALTSAPHKQPDRHTVDYGQWPSINPSNARHTHKARE